MNPSFLYHKLERNPLIFLVVLISFSFLLHLYCIAKASLIVEETYYWNYAQHLDFSYLDHPPMVALLIKFFTTLFGNHEFSVRLACLTCWMVAGFYSYKLTELINKGAGCYSLMLLAVLPYFFIESIIITPDAPLIACWSASLYCLYRALVLNEARYWLQAGFWLGCGMISKYTICFLGLASLCYIVSTPAARHWFRRKEPYLGVLIASLIFAPVIYWNATHEWVSFLFQSNSRFHELSHHINLHKLIGLILVFITPVGLWGMYELINKNALSRHLITPETKRFIIIFTAIPLGFFLIFSLNHQIKFNWTGPLYLAVIPWLALLMNNFKLTRTIWLRMALGLLIGYSATVLLMNYSKSAFLQHTVFLKTIYWPDFVKQMNLVAQNIETTTHQKPIFVPLDSYAIASELAFYQTKLLADKEINSIYSIIGSHLFGEESLMYRYWADEQVTGRPLILIAKEAWRFDNYAIAATSNELYPLASVWTKGEGQGLKNIPYYYKVVTLK